ncbi:ABC transporter, ATP-binding protein [Bacillus sp. JCM 19045]|nr:ABC transporter, ATP-binding protein [Bacillus sp. JCM 19045]
MAFRDEDVHKKIAVLSGGERVRTALAIVFLGHFNVLILDEPTNYLDLTTKESLMDVLKAYPGTVIFVTHDRALIKDVATHQLSFYDEMPVIRELAESKIRERSLEENSLLMVDLKLTEIIGKLGLATDEEEKAVLEQDYHILLEKKKRLRQQ